MLHRDHETRFEEDVAKEQRSGESEAEPAGDVAVGPSAAKDSTFEWLLGTFDSSSTLTTR